MGVLSSRSRKVGFVIACLVSVLIGGALVFFLVQPRRVELVRTAELYAVLAMLVLPGFTAWANRRVRREVPARAVSARELSARVVKVGAARESAERVPRAEERASGDATAAVPARVHAAGSAREPRSVPKQGAPRARNTDVIVIPEELLRPYYTKTKRPDGAAASASRAARRRSA